MLLRTDGLNDNAPHVHRLICVNTWSSVGNYLGRIGKCGLVGRGVSLGASFQVSKDTDCGSVNVIGPIRS